MRSAAGGGFASDSGAGVFGCYGVIDVHIIVICRPISATKDDEFFVDGCGCHCSEGWRDLSINCGFGPGH